MARIFCRPNRPNGAENSASATPGSALSRITGSGGRVGVKASLEGRFALLAPRSLKAKTWPSGRKTRSARNEIGGEGTFLILIFGGPLISVRLDPCTPAKAS